jgi:type II secretory pathway component PulM
MTLTKREKNIAIGLGATLLALGVYYLIVQPYFDSLAQIDQDYQTKLRAWNDHISLANRKVDLEKKWEEIKNGGLSSDQSRAEGQAWNAVSDWANAAGVQITSLKSDRNTDAAPFQIIGFHVVANGSVPTIARLLKSFETATIPVRVDEIQITPRREGTDELQIRMSVSTLCLQPEADKPAKTGEDTSTAEVQP